MGTRAARWGTVWVCALTLGCASWRPPNVPLDQIDPQRGYRPDLASQRRAEGEMWIFLAFSGGGTRAASFAYGVLEELRDTQVVLDGQPVRLLDEVDSISGVSGGSFPAAYYGLFGDRIFDEFEGRFLKRNVQRALVLRTLAPWNALRLLTPYLNRSDLAARYYHENVFDGATFGDLAAVRGPRIHINATDLPDGHRVTFSQDGFDAICTDLDPFPIAYAVAASSAVPLLLSPVTLRNYTGDCGWERPEWLDTALESRSSNPRGYRAALEGSSYLDVGEKPYVHLVDGGIADNLGLRAPLDRIAQRGGNIDTLRQEQGLDLPKQLVVVIVNAETEPDPAISLSRAAPSVAASLNLVSGAQIRRYNFETLLLAQSSVRQWGEDLSTPGNPVRTHLVEVSFDLLSDPSERRYFKRLPTSFVLSDEQVDRLREAGRRLLRESPQFQELIQESR